MGTTLVIFLTLAIYLHAASITSSSSTSSVSTSTAAALVDNTSLNTTPPSSPFDMDKELAKIATSCLTRQDREQLSGNLYKHLYSPYTHLITEAEDIIGLTEMRAVLGFAPPGPWTNYREPGAAELAAASTVEEYFELKEPRSEDSSLDSEFFFEKNFPPVIAFLDKRFPGIRMIFRRRFEEILRLDLGGRIDRKTVDYMINEYTENILPRVFRATKEMHNVRECRRRRLG